MRRMLKFLVTLSILWALVWGGVGLLVKRGFEQWFAEQINRGWQIEYSELTLSGFPFHHRIAIENPVFAGIGR